MQIKFSECMQAELPTNENLNLTGDWNTSRYTDLVFEFTTAASQSSQIHQFSWDFFDLPRCVDAVDQGLTPTCWGTNPSTPYAFPVFGGGSSAPMHKEAALISIAITPPKARYFSFTPYLKDRYYSNIGEYSSPYGSIADSINAQTIKTAGSDIPGGAPFGELTAIVLTANKVALLQAQIAFRQIGFPDSAVNYILIPEKQLNVAWAGAANPDRFSMLLRTAFPDNQAEFDAYRSNIPITSLYLMPYTKAYAELPELNFTEPGTGNPLSGHLELAQAQLIEDIKARYQDDYVFESYGKNKAWAPDGHSCILNNTTCGGDSHDALYLGGEKYVGDGTGAKERFTATHPKDLVFFIGANHVKLNKASYFNHSIADPLYGVGVVAMADDQAPGSAQYHAGPTTLLSNQLDDMYVFSFSHDCGDIKFCSNIQGRDPVTKIGINVAEPADLPGRIYLDPETGVRPAEDEVLIPVTLIGRYRGPNR